MLRFVVFLALLAAVVYAFFWLLDRRKRGRGGNGGGRPAPRRPLGPDDDDAFLRELDWKQRHPRRTGEEETP
jgi:hypothetical protein